MVTAPFTRAIVIVLDSVGIGELPDAAAYGDQGSNTLGNIARRIPLKLPTLRALGLDRLVDLGGGGHTGPPLRLSGVGADPRVGPIGPPTAVGRMAEASPGKDSVTGHWEMMGIILDRAFPVFPNGFSKEILDEFARQTGREVIGNKAASGTQILDELGSEHMRTGALIVYTSADSVFQIAAHEEVVAIPELYRVCEIAYRLVGEGLGVGRVIARPFVGAPGAFKRTANRRDYALPPAGETLMDRVKAASLPVVAIGKIDVRIAKVLPKLRDRDLLIVTADHGNDPTTASTDHAREYVPLLAAGAHVRGGADLGTRLTFADLGQTLADIFGVGPMPHGTSFLDEITQRPS